MKFEGVLAAYEGYDLQRSEDHRVDPVLPEDIGRVHAYREVLSFRVKPGLPRFAARHGHWEAVCGWGVKVLLPQRFETTDPSACEKCVRVLSEPVPSPA
jgi:hypothetical protein